MARESMVVFAFAVIFCNLQNAACGECPTESSLLCIVSQDYDGGPGCMTEKAYIELKDGTICPGCYHSVCEGYLDDQGCPYLACPLVQLPSDCAGKYYSQKLDYGSATGCSACGTFSC